MKNNSETIKTLAKESKRARARLEKAVNAFVASRAGQSHNGILKFRATLVEDREDSEVALVNHAGVHEVWRVAEFYDVDDERRVRPLHLWQMNEDSILRLVKRLQRLNIN